MSSPRRARLRRLLLRTALALVVLAVLLRAALPLALPRALAAWAESNGLRADYGELDLSLLGGSVDLWHLVIDRAEPEPGAAPLLALEFATVDVDVSALFAGRLRIHRVEVDGLDLSLRRRADGSLDLPFGGGAPPEPAAAEEPGEPGPPPVALPLELAALRVQDVRVRFVDLSVEPPLDLPLELELALSDLGSPERPARLDLRFAAGEALDELRVTGTIETPPGRARAELALDVDALHPRVLAGLLAPLGLEPLAERVEASLAVRAELASDGADEPSVAAELRLADLRVAADGDAALELPEAIVRATFDADGALAVGEAVARGLRARAARRADGVLVAAGFALTGAPAGEAATEPEPAPAPASGAASGGPASPLTVARAALEDGRLRLDDAAADEPLELVLETVELADLALGAAEPAPAKLTVRLSAPGVAQAIELAGEVTPPAPAPGDPGRSALAADLALSATGCAPERLAPYLAAAGVVCTLESGELRGRLAARAVLDGAGVVDATAELLDLALSDGERELLRIERAGADGVRVAGGRLELARAALSGTRLPFERAADGSLALLGLRTAPGAAAEPFALALERLDLEVTDVALGGGEPGRARLSGRVSVPGLLGEARLTGALETAPGPLDATLSLALSAGGFETGAVLPGAPELAAAAPGLALGLELSARAFDDGGETRVEPARFELTLDSADTFRRVVVEGDVVARGATAKVDARLVAWGIAPGELARLLPPGVELAMADGRVEARIAAESAPAPDGGASARLELSLDVADGGAPLVALGSARVVASRLDAAAGVFALDEVALEGLTLDARRVAPDRIEVAGLALVAAPAPPAETPETADAAEPRGTAAAPQDAVAASAPAAGEAPEPSGATPGTPGGSATDAQAPPAPASAPAAVAEATAQPPAVAPTPPGSAPPRVTLEALAVGLERFTFRDETAPEAEPLVLSAALASPEPLVLCDAQPDLLAPVRLALTVRAQPVLEELSLDLSAAPFADRPRLELELAGSGLSGAGITAVLPELAQVLDGSGLAAGSFGARLRAELDVRRRGPLDLGLSEQLGAELELEDVALRADDGAVVAGVDAVHAVVARWSPHTGDLRLSALEVTTPRLRAERSARGLELGGLVLLDRAPAEGEETAVAIEAAGERGGAAAEAAHAPEAPGAAPERAPEIAVDRLVLDGIDVVVRDTTNEPAMTIPLDALDVEVTGFTTRALEEQRSIAFAAYVGAGSVDLPQRTKSSFLGGLARRARDLAGMGAATGREERPLFEEISASGRVALYPEPTGWAKLSVASLELPAFAGPASAAGVKIGDGRFDGNVDLRLRGERGVRTDARFTFGDLSLSEGANGPISRFLKLPAPLDVVLFALKNDAGEQVIPLGFSVDPEGGVSVTQLSSAAVSALGRVIADAVASSPLRVASTVTDFVGLTGGAPEDLAQSAVTLAFPAADPTVPADALAPARSLLRRVKADDDLGVALTHVLGPDDVERAAALANPSPAACRALARDLAQERASLLRRRATAAADARAEWSVGRVEAARAASDRLRALDAELGRTERALDHLGELLRPGAERRADKRTREACLEIANARLAAVREALLRSSVPPSRIELRRARFEVPEDAPEGGGRVVLMPKRLR